MNRSTLKSIRVNNLVFHYVLTEARERPSRGNLVLIHGSLVDLRSWDRQIEPFSRHYRTVAYSRRYNYPNPNAWNGAAHSVGKEVDDLAGLIDALQLAPAVLVGHSLGAYIALSLAARSPDRVEALVLSEPPVIGLLDQPGLKPLHDDHLSRLWGPVRAAYVKGDVEAALKATITYFQGEGQYDRFSPPLRQVLRDNSREWQAIALSPDPFTVVPEHGIQSIQKPVLLLTGERSLPFFTIIADRIKELNPGSTVCTIPGAGHEMWDSHPQACRRAALRFLR